VSALERVDDLQKRLEELSARVAAPGATGATGATGADLRAAGAASERAFEALGELDALARGLAPAEVELLRGKLRRAATLAFATLHAAREDLGRVGDHLARVRRTRRVLAHYLDSAPSGESCDVEG